MHPGLILWSLPEVLPPSLTELALGEFFNQPLEVGLLPPGLTALSFEGSFNQPIVHGMLPSSLTRLGFGDVFDQPLAVEVLPLGLTKLRLGFCFTQFLLDGVLPHSLTWLVLGYSLYFPVPYSSDPSGYREPIHHFVLPPNLSHLTMDIAHPEETFYADWQAVEKCCYAEFPDQADESWARRIDVKEALVCCRR